MKRANYNRTTLVVNESTEGELLIHKVDRIVNNGEPITEGVALIYNRRDEGVNPEHDIRANRRDIAMQAMDINAKSIQARREDKFKGRKTKDSIENPDKGDTEGKSTEGTEK